MSKGPIPKYRAVIRKRRKEPYETYMRMLQTVKLNVSWKDNVTNGEIHKIDSGLYPRFGLRPKKVGGHLRHSQSLHARKNLWYPRVSRLLTGQLNECLRELILQTIMYQRLSYVHNAVLQSQNKNVGVKVSSYRHCIRGTQRLFSVKSLFEGANIA